MNGLFDAAGKHVSSAWEVSVDGSRPHGTFADHIDATVIPPLTVAVGSGYQAPHEVTRGLGEHSVKEEFLVPKPEGRGFDSMLGPVQSPSPPPPPIAAPVLSAAGVALDAAPAGAYDGVPVATAATSCRPPLLRLRR